MENLTKREKWQVVRFFIVMVAVIVIVCTFPTWLRWYYELGCTLGENETVQRIVLKIFGLK